MKDSMNHRTHYSHSEVFGLVKLDYPNLSAMVLLELMEKHDIQPVSAGCDRLYPAEVVERLLEILSQTTLLERNGFLVLA